MTNKCKDPGILLVANWDSKVGFAWWLMESYWAQIAIHFNKRYGCHLAYPSISTLPTVIEQAPLQTHEIDFATKSLKCIPAQICFILKHRIKIIYFSDQVCFSWRYLLFKIFGVRKIIVHDHTPGSRSKPRGFKKAIKSIISNTPMYSADAFFGATEYVRTRLTEVVCANPDKCFAIPNGIPLSPCTKSQKNLEHFNIPATSLVIVGTGRAHRYKGVIFALDCIYKLRQIADVEFRYLYCGDGPDLNLFKGHAKNLGMEDICHFPGNISNIKEVIRACDIAFHPSSGEVGYSLSILEYMEAELPLILPDNPSVCGATEHMRTGIIYKENDIDSATMCLHKLLNDKGLRKKLGLNAKLEVQAKYNLNKTHKVLINSFEKSIV